MSNLLASIPKIPSAHYGIKSNRAFSSQQRQLAQFILISCLSVLFCRSLELRNAKPYSNCIWPHLISLWRKFESEFLDDIWVSKLMSNRPRSVLMGSWLKVTIAALPRAKKKLALVKAAPVQSRRPNFGPITLSCWKMGWCLWFYWEHS